MSVFPFVQIPAQDWIEALHGDSDSENQMQSRRALLAQWRVRSGI